MSDRDAGRARVATSGVDEAREDHAIGRMERIVAPVLRYGVLLSFVVVLAGSTWLFAGGDTGYGGLSVSGAHAVDTLTAYHADGAAQWFPTSPTEVLDGVRDGRPYAIIALGLLLLIVTPVIPVAVSVVTFAWSRDRLYTLITLYVLTVLLVSFAIGKGG